MRSLCSRKVPDTAKYRRHIRAFSPAPVWEATHGASLVAGDTDRYVVEDVCRCHTVVRNGGSRSSIPTEDDCIRVDFKKPSKTTWTK